jgi:hypothetical protein
MQHLDAGTVIQAIGVSASDYSDHDSYPGLDVLVIRRIRTQPGKLP